MDGDGKEKTTKKKKGRKVDGIMESEFCDAHSAIGPNSSSPRYNWMNFVSIFTCGW